MVFFEILGIGTALYFLDKFFPNWSLIIRILALIIRTSALIIGISALIIGISALIFGFSWCWTNFFNENWNAVIGSVILFSPVIYILYDKRKFKKYVEQNPGTKTDW